MDNFAQIKQALMDVDVDDEDATALARKLIDEGFKDLTKIKRLNKDSLKEMGITKLFEVQAILNLAHAADRPKSTKSVVAFLSHVKKESGTEASVVYDRLTAEFPERTFFLDSQDQFPLAHLTERVDASYVFLILASPGYIHRPFCIVELCQSLKSGAKIAVVNVVPVDTVGFDYGKVSQEIKEQGIVFYQNLLDASGWEVVKKAGYNLEDVQKAVDRFLGQKGFEFHAMGHQMVRKVELDVICQSIAPLVVEFDAQVKVATVPVAKKVDAPLSKADRRRMPPPEGMKHHIFISYCQETGMDQVDSLYRSLMGCGLDVIFDRILPQITLIEVEKAVDESSCLLVFLSKGVMTRSFCQAEIRRAIKLEHPILFVHEEDRRCRGFAEIYDLKAEAPEDLQCLFNQLEIIPFRRRYFEREAMVAEIEKRCLTLVA